MDPFFFEKASDLRKWFEQNHATETELCVGFYKVSSGKPSIVWGQSVDEALCFGWIDGVRRSIDKERYCIRFTPRKPGSTWSAINVRKLKELKKKGLMHPGGLTAFEKKQEKKSGIYSYENKPAAFSPAYQRKFKANPEAWAFFCSQAPSYQRTAIYWVLSAKQETTRERRLNVLIGDSQAGLRVGPLRPTSKK
jgi:uncharacterized protein YdeI (YjbR/CyaY-like superfamily)